MSKMKMEKMNRVFDTVLPYLIVWVFLCLVAVIAFSVAIPRAEKKYDSSYFEQQARIEYLPTNSAETSVTIAEPAFSDEAVRTEVIIK